MKETLRNVKPYITLTVNGNYTDFISAIHSYWKENALNKNFRVERAEDDCDEDYCTVNIETLDELHRWLDCFKGLDVTVDFGIRHDLVSSTIRMFNDQHVKNIYNFDKDPIFAYAGIENGKLQADLSERIEKAITVLRSSN